MNDRRSLGDWLRKASATEELPKVKCACNLHQILLCYVCEYHFWNYTYVQSLQIYTIYSCTPPCFHRLTHSHTHTMPLGYYRATQSSLKAIGNWTKMLFPQIILTACHTDWTLNLSLYKRNNPILSILKTSRIDLVLAQYFSFPCS